MNTHYCVYTLDPHGNLDRMESPAFLRRSDAEDSASWRRHTSGRAREYAASQHTLYSGAALVSFDGPLPGNVPKSVVLVVSAEASAGVAP